MNLYIGPFSQTEFWNLVSGLSMAGLIVLICFGYLLPQIRYLKALLEGNATNISSRSLWFRGLSLCLVIALYLLWFPYSDASLQLLASEVTEGISDKPILGMDRLEFFKYQNLGTLVIVAFSVTVFTHKLIDLAFTAANLAAAKAQKASQNRMAQQQCLNSAPLPQNQKKISIGWVCVGSGALFALIIFFFVNFNTSLNIKNFSNDDPTIYWGLSKTDALNLAKVLILLTVIVCVFLLVIIPLIAEAIVSAASAASAASNKSQGFAPISKAALFKGKVIITLLITVTYCAIHFDFLVYIFSKI